MMMTSTWRGLFFDHAQKHTKKRLVLVEGNHEYRIKRWAAKSREGKSIIRLVNPEIQLMLTENGEKRKDATYIAYGPGDGTYPHYKLNSRTVLIHGWSYAKHVTSAHLDKSQGKTVLLGHCHRMESKTTQNIWGAGTVQCHAIGCLCKRQPVYGLGTPVEWTNGFCLGYHGRHSDTYYPIAIANGSCILPDGKEVKV